MRRRWTASALSAVAVATAVVVPLALLGPRAAPVRLARQGGHGTVPLSDPSLTPPGWTPLTYRDAQISVPSSWVVQPAQGSICGVTTNGAVHLGRRYNPARLSRSGCQLPPTTVFVSAIPYRPAPVLTRRINGIPVGRLPSVRGAVSYAVPSLGVEVTAVGPKAGLVIETLTRSPRSVALAAGRAFPVPRGWRWHHFGGIVFAAPRAWRIQRTDRWGNCFGRFVLAGTLRLSTARVFGCRGGLASPTGLAEFRPVAGMTVGTGRLVNGDARDAAYSRCTQLRGMRECVQKQGTVTGVFLALMLFRHGRPGPTEVDIGLAGTGAIARTIFDSIRPG